jgi:MFS family permease
MIVPLVVACAYFMENFDGTVITTALPAMARSFHMSAAAVSAGITAYMLAVAVCIPMSGWAADRYGSRSVFRAAIVVFVLASAWCATAIRLDAFIAARVLQGVGGAMMVPVGRLIVLRSVDKTAFVRAMSIVTVPGVVGQVLGPPVGGFFTSYLSWRWIF